MNVDQEIISPSLARELDAKIRAAGGDIESVRHELEDRLHQMEKQADMSGEGNAYRMDIALILSEIEYLDQKLSTNRSGPPVKEKHPGLVGRLREKLSL